MSAGGVAAVLLCWNDVDRVLALVEGLQRQGLPPDRVIVVDNGSDRAPARVLAAAYPDCETITLAHNRGFAAAVILGIEHALAGGADWIWLLNTDIELPADALPALRAAAGADPRCGMTGAVLVEPDGSVQARGGGRVNLWTGMACHVVSAAERCDYMSAACLLLRAEMLREIGLFDEGYFFYWEDVDLGFRAREAGWTFAVAGDCLVVHREGSSLGRWSQARWYHLFRGMRRFLRSRAPLPRTATLVRLVQHSIAMAAHGRRDALRGAWRGVRAGVRA